MYQIWKKLIHGKVILHGSKILQKWCKEEEKIIINVKKIGKFLEVYILHTANLISFKFIM